MRLAWDSPCAIRHRVILVTKDAVQMDMGNVGSVLGGTDCSVCNIFLGIDLASLAIWVLSHLPSR